MKKFIGFEKGINLGGWFSQYECTEEHLNTYITEDDIVKIAGWGMDHVRIPVDYNVFETEEGQYKESGFEHMQRAIYLCRKHKLNLILDLHKTAGYSYEKMYSEKGFFESEELQERFYRLWLEFAKHFVNDSDIVAFELLNEVNDQELCDIWNRISLEAIRRIRTVCPDIKIIVGGYWNNSVDAVKDIAMPYDENIVYTFHCYDPFLFTHQAAYWVDQMTEDFRIAYPGDINLYRKKVYELNLEHIQTYESIPDSGFDKNYFLSRFAGAVKVCEERGVALHCGEYGVINKADPQSTVNWYKDINAAFRQYGIARSAWSYKKVDYGISDEHMAEMCDELVKHL